MEDNTIIDDFTDEDKQQSEGLKFWNPKEQESVIGIVKVVEEGRYGGKKIGLKTNDSEDELTFVPELTALNEKLSNVELEQKVKIVYLGEDRSKNSGRMFMKFDVFIK